MKKCLSEEETAESDCGEEATDESSDWREVRRSWDREQPTTVWPLLAISRARARPSPFPTPVMSTVRLPPPAPPAVAAAALLTMFIPPNDVVMASPANADDNSSFSKVRRSTHFLFSFGVSISNEIKKLLQQFYFYFLNFLCKINYIIYI